MKNIHVILPDACAEEVERLARSLDQTPSGVIRRALERFFESERKRRIAEKMNSYAEEMAQRSGEFVKETGPMVLKKLLKETRW